MNKSVIIAHGDLDGCVGAQICHKWIKQKEGQDHEIILIPSSYESVNDSAREVFENNEYKHIHIVDICFSEELLPLMPDNCWVFDHHDTSKHILGHKNCVWKHEYCGAVVAWKHLFPGVKMSKPFNKLLGLANEYDMWIGEKGPRKICHDLNNIYRLYRFNDFFDKFYDGFDEFSSEETEYLESFWRRQQTILNDSEKISYGDDVVMIICNNELFNVNYWCNHFLTEENFNVIIILYPHSERLSMRSSKRVDWFHSGYWIRDNVQNVHNSKGGHQRAAGCSIDGMPINDVLLLGKKIQDLIDSKKDVAKAAM